MAKGKLWTVEDERQLRQLLIEKKPRRSIAKVLGKTLTSVRMKTSRLGLVVVDESEKNTPSTTTFDKLILPIELPSIEQELKTLVGALKGLEAPNLDKTDVLRLRGMLKGEGLLNLEPIFTGRFSNIKLNFENYLLVDILTEIEVEKKIDFS